MLAKNPENHQRTKHINVRYHYIREKEKDGTIAIDYLPIEEIIADGLTKGLTPVKMKVLIKQFFFIIFFTSCLTSTYNLLVIKNVIIDRPISDECYY